MATHDYNIANQDGASFRSDLNNALAAIVSNNSSSTAPATTFAHQIWVDTTANVIKQRNAANDAWIELWRIDGGFNAKTFSSNVTLNAQSDLRFADSDSSNWVAFQAPATVSSNVTWTLPASDGTSGQVIETNGSGVLSWADAGGVTDNITEGNTSAEVVDTGSDGHFKVVTEGTERARIDSSGKLLVNATSTINTGTGDKVQVAETVGANILLGRNDTLVTDGNNLGQIAAYSFHGSSWNESARIQFAADGAHAGSGDVPGRISFQVCTDGAAGVGEQMQLDNAGNLKFNSGYGSAATAYGCRAWVNFNGTGTVAIRESGNVSSITDNGTGDYTVNFTTAMPDTDYCVSTGLNQPTYSGTIVNFGVRSDTSDNLTTMSTTAVRLYSYYFNTGPSGGAGDRGLMCVAIFR